MREFRLPPRKLLSRTHDVRMIWLVSSAAVVLSLGALFFIGYGPFSVVHRIGPLLIWVVILLVVCALGVDFVALRRIFERVKQDLSFLLTDTDLIRKSTGYPDIEIALSQIKSLQEQSAYLVVTGGNPERRIAVPKDVGNFELLKSELARYGTFASPQPRFRFGWITMVLSIVCWWLLIWSRNTNIVKVTGVLVLILLGWSSIQLNRLLRHSRKRIALWMFLGICWFGALFLVYIRVFGGSLGHLKIG